DGVVECVGRNREIIDAVGWKLPFVFDRLETLVQAPEAVGLVEAGHIVEAAGKGPPALFVDLEPGVFLHCLARAGAEIFRRHLGAREPHHRALCGHDAPAAVNEIVQGGQEFSARQIARGAKNHYRAWWYGPQPLEGDDLVHVGILLREADYAYATSAGLRSRGLIFLVR